MNMKRISHNQGFTLIEMVVSVGLFTVVLFMATSAFLTVVNADRKSRAVRIGADNLNLALEDMQRRIKTGSTYYCWNAGPDIGGVGDCASAVAGTTFSFTEQDGATRTTYAWDSVTKAIYRESVGLVPHSGETIRVTAPEISIDNVKFVVQGSTPGVIADGGDSIQPHVKILIKGSIAGKTLTAFDIQTMITQRNYDS